jgi:CheY-like chemotaxis protein
MKETGECGALEIHDGVIGAAVSAFPEADFAEANAKPISLLTAATRVDNFAASNAVPAASLLLPNGSPQLPPLLRGAVGAAQWAGSAIVQALTAHGLVFLFSYSPTLRTLLSWSSNAPEVLGVKDAAITGSGNLFLRHVHPDDRFTLLDQLEKALHGQGSYHVTYRWIRPDTRELRWLHCRAALTSSPDPDHGPALEGPAFEGPVFEGLILDITSELSAYGFQPHRAEITAAVLDQLAGMFFTLDEDLHVLWTSRNFETFSTEQPCAFGFGDAQFRGHDFGVGINILDCFHNPERRSELRQSCQDLIEGDKEKLELQYLVAAGKPLKNVHFTLVLSRVQRHGVLVSILGFIQNSSTNFELQQELRRLEQAQKLQQLATGLIHHLNDTLQHVAAHAHSLCLHSDKPEVLRESGEALREGLRKAASLSQQLLTLEEAADSSSAIELNSLCTRCMRAFIGHTQAAPKVSLHLGNPPALNLNQTQLETGLRLLLDQLCQQLDASGSLDLRTGSKGDEAYILLEACLPATQTKSQFLTPPDASIYKRVFDALQARVSLHSSDGGRMLTLRVQFAEAVALTQQTTPLPELPTEPVTLLIDDDQKVLESTAAILSGAGIPCIAAQGSKQALIYARRYKHCLRMILVDAVLPGMSPSQLLRRLRRQCPTAKIVGFSGSGSEHSRALREQGAVEILYKPVDPEVMLRAVREVLPSN